MKKILIFYASYGGGHLSAAKSIKQYIEEYYDDVEIQMIDCVKYVNKALDKVTTAAYREMAKKAPWAWEKVYYNSQDGLLGKVSTYSNKIMAVKIAKLFREFKDEINVENIEFEVLEIKNKFFGKDINVAGLIVGQDIIDTIKNKDIDTLVIPSVMLKKDENGYIETFLDNKTTTDIKKSSKNNNMQIKILDDCYSFDEIKELINSL